MTYSDPHTSSPFDQALSRVLGLTWVPWVGTNYANLPVGRKVLIVAESHYTNEQDAQNAPRRIEETIADKTYTRAVVAQSLVRAEWSTRTLSTMHKLFYSPANRAAFWDDVAFFNLIQRPMWYRDNNPERPTWEDFWKGWEAFLGAVEVLRPDHILFIGVAAANHFNGFMSHHGHGHAAVKWAEKVGSAYARTASLIGDGFQTPLHFIKHCGSYFRTELWIDYLHRNAPDLMASLAISAGTKSPTPAPPKRLHVLGMAKSSLDLRGAKAPKLELDFLRLAYAVRELREAGDEAVGYLVVLVPSVARTAEVWCGKYATGESVAILYHEIQGDVHESLVREKADNAAGLIRERRFEEAERELSLAGVGKSIGETYLREAIEAKHPGISASTTFPLGIQWDYYGTLPVDG